MIRPPVPLRTALAEAVQRLDAAGVESARWDAEQLVAHVLGVARTSLPVIPNVDAAQYDVLRALVQRRVNREPLQHIVGAVGFRYVELAVGPGVFVPRPETESVVQWAVDALARMRAERPSVELAIVKLNEGVSGEGNANVDLRGLPAPGDPAAAPQIERGRMIKIVGSMKPADAARVLEQMTDTEAAAFIAELSDRKAAQILGSLPPQRAAAISRAALHQGRSTP